MAFVATYGPGDYVYLPNWGGADNQEARVHVLDIFDPDNPPPSPITSATWPTWNRHF
ncbi:MAG: hypothetical protein ACYTHJ_08590 [Planctomycetota bacterium]